MRSPRERDQGRGATRRGPWAEEGERQVNTLAEAMEKRGNKSRLRPLEEGLTRVQTEAMEKRGKGAEA